MIACIGDASTASTLDEVQQVVPKTARRRDMSMWQLAYPSAAVRFDSLKAGATDTMSSHAFETAVKRAACGAAPHRQTVVKRAAPAASCASGEAGQVQQLGPVIMHGNCSVGGQADRLRQS